jgi:hypothetical protein
VEQLEHNGADSTTLELLQWMIRDILIVVTRTGVVVGGVRVAATVRDDLIRKQSMELT